MKTAIVSGALANKCQQGGAAWTRMSWARAFETVGMQVHFLEQIGRDTGRDASGEPVPLEDSENVAFFRTAVDQAGLAADATLMTDDGETIYGRSAAELESLVDGAEVLINISGNLRRDLLLSKARRRVYLDLDPGYTQLWADARLGGFTLHGHHYYYTVGENIGRPVCPIPTGGVEWRHTRQPVVLEDWPVEASGDRSRFTTVASWRGAYGAIQWNGRRLGVKAHEFRKFVGLPERTGRIFELALEIGEGDEKDLRLLQDCGWHVVSARQTVPDLEAFRKYVGGSGGEFSVAQEIYTTTCTGWFSDRTVRYLASGKPALVQDTGFARHLPVGQGLLAFRTLDEAADGAEQIAADYEHHAREARAVAERHFEASLVIGRLLDDIGVTT